MAFKTTITIAGKQFETLTTSYKLNRDVDEKGMPASNIYGGRIEAEFRSTADTSVLAAMVNDQTKAITGKVTYMSGESESVMKELTFEDAYIVRYRETLTAADSNPMQIKVAITARMLKMGSAQHENEWPKS